MRRKSYLSLLIPCVIFSSGICNLSPEKNELSDFHIRKKRLINKTPQGDRPVRITRVSYIVNIQKNEVTDCAGSILEPNIIITAAHCVEELATYRVLSGSSSENLGTRHKITGIIFHPEYHPTRFPHDIALLIIYPFIDFVHSPNWKIILHEGPIPENTRGTISGWGSNSEPPNETYPEFLRSITVPTISLNECRSIYGHMIEITEKNICTLDRSGQKRCSHVDSGDPLVVAGKLAGVHAGNGNLRDGVGPDIFMNLSDLEYRDWVLSQIANNPANEHSPRIPLNTSNPHKPLGRHNPRI